LVLAKLCFEKMFKFIFQRILMQGNNLYFCENKKVLEKFLACMSVLKIQICNGKNFKSREKQIWQKIKYEISIGLPSARARRFESDERDLSPTVFTTARLVLENWTRTSWRPYATPSLHVFSLILWS